MLSTMPKESAGPAEPAPSLDGAGFGDPYELASTVEALVARLREVARRNRAIKVDPELADLAAEALTRARKVKVDITAAKSDAIGTRRKGLISWRSHRGSPGR
jgi:hypothetical protein